MKEQTIGVVIVAAALLVIGSIGYEVATTPTYGLPIRTGTVLHPFDSFAFAVGPGPGRLVGAWVTSEHVMAWVGNSSTTELHLPPSPWPCNASFNATLAPGVYRLDLIDQNHAGPAYGGSSVNITVIRTIEVLYPGTSAAVIATYGTQTAACPATSPQTLPMSLPIPAGTVIRITNITNVNGTIVNGSIAAFTVTPPGGRLVGAAYMVTGGTLVPWPWVPTIGCPLYSNPPGTVILNDTLDPGSYGLWILCVPQRPPATPAYPIIINVTETIQVVYG